MGDGQGRTAISAPHLHVREIGHALADLPGEGENVLGRDGVVGRGALGWP